MLSISCGGVDSDARKAASLTNKSIEKTNQLKLEEAERWYKESRKIIEKYESHGKSEKFFELYRQYRDEERITHPEWQGR